MVLDQGLEEFLHRRAVEGTIAALSGASQRTDLARF